MTIPRIPESLRSRHERRQHQHRAFLRLTGTPGRDALQRVPDNISAPRVTRGTTAPIYIIHYADLPVRLTGFGHTADWTPVLHPHQATAFDTEDSALDAAIAHGLGGFAYRIAPVTPEALINSLKTEH